MNKKYIAVGLLVLVAAWYGFILCLPELADGHGVLAFPARVETEMRALGRSGKPYDEVRAALDDLSWSWRDITYTPTLTRQGDESWVLVARPNKPKRYSSGFLARLVSLDFHQHTIHTYRIRRGMQYPDIVDRERTF
jgi:hypothetical protein